MRKGWIAILLIAAFSRLALADQIAASSDAQEWNIHFQTTTVTQTHGSFTSPYQGPNSLNPNFEIPSSVTSTLFVGHKLWRDAYLFVNPEETIGGGLSQTHGIAAFPNGEAYRVDDALPKTNLSRIFFQQDFGLGGGSENVPDSANQFQAAKDIKRITFVAGKFSLNDYLDDNTYSHDPRTQFLNWALMDTAAWDYASDTRGYTWGFYGELTFPVWSLRLALVQEPVSANSLDLDGNIVHAHSENLEFEYRYEYDSHPGKIRVLGFTNQANMGNYRQAVQLAAGTGSPPDITQTRSYSTKWGAALNLEQEVARDLGVFSRIGFNDGATETWAFTEAERSLSLGAMLQGTRWNRSGDTAGLAIMVDALSKDHADYLSAGGLGILLGDGALNYAPEDVVEAYYRFKLTRELGITPDFMFVNHPGYNADRGPVPIYAVRVHFEI